MQPDVVAWGYFPMSRLPTRICIRTYGIAFWLILFCGTLYLHFFHAGFFENQLQRVFSASLLLGYALYMLLGCLRGLTLIPVTSLILLGLLFFAPVPLFILTMAGILVSSASVYYFSKFLRLDEFFERKHQNRITRIKSILQKNELPIIIAWSLFPLVPTDLICYVCGTLRINFKKFIMGILIGEGITCGIYIFLGHYLIRALKIF